MDEILKLEDLSLFCRRGIGPVTYKKYLEFKDRSDFNDDSFSQKYQLDKALLENVINQSFEYVTYRSNNYPQLLREAADSPIVLFYKGQLNLLQSTHIIGIAGTRNPTDYGVAVCRDIVKLAQGDVVFVTGLALGVDTIIAEECIKNNIGIIAVLPANMKNVVPNSNKKLVERILANNGLILWENPLQEVTNGSFIQRNRIIAGVSNYLIVIEADLKSGSLTTADFAFDYNRDVYAVPGKIYSSKSRGTHYLIKENKAKILANLSDIPAFGNLSKNSSNEILNLDKVEQKLYYAILDEPKGLDELSEMCSEYPILLSKLLNLELLGYIKKAHDGKYRIV